MSRKIEVVPYDPAWEDKYVAEAKLISDLLQSELIAIHHIGSTAIPGIAAKPVIDMLVEIADIEQLDKFSPSLEALGYQPHGEYGIPGRRYFCKERDGLHEYHLHVYRTGHFEIGRHLRFRDYLIAHPEQAQAYSQLKIDLAGEFTYNSAAYTEAKTKFIRGIDEIAKQG